MINGGEWHKNDTSYYAVYYINSYGERELDVVTNNFGGWLKETNKDRVDEDHLDAACYGIKYNAKDFWLDDVEVFSRREK